VPVAATLDALARSTLRLWRRLSQQPSRPNRIIAKKTTMRHRTHFQWLEIQLPSLEDLAAELLPVLVLVLVEPLLVLVESVVAAVAVAPVFGVTTWPDVHKLEYHCWIFVASSVPHTLSHIPAAVVCRVVRYPDWQKHD